MVSQHTIAGHNGIPTTEYTEMTGRNLHSENIKNGEPFTQWGKYAINMQAISCHVNRPLCLHIAKTRSMEILTSLCYNCKVCWCYIWLCVRVYAYLLVYFWKPKFSDREYLPDAWWTCPIFSDLMLILGYTIWKVLSIKTKIAHSKNEWARYIYSLFVES